MYRDVGEYLEKLKRELEGADPALIQDALSDAEGHLRTALEEEGILTSGLSESKALESIIEKYGTPSEVASAYRTIESRIPPVLAAAQPQDSRSLGARFFGVMAEARAWGAFSYMLLALFTGMIFGGWALLGGLISACSLLFIIGLPLFGLFLLSIRGIALLEGRIVEALLGIRMPRKPLFFDKNQGLTDKFKTLVTDAYSWRAFLYAVLLFPLGLVFAVSFGLLFTFSLSFLLSPVLELILHLPLELFGTETYTPVWFLPVVCIAGFFLLPLTFHLAKFIGKIHGRFAKSMLVRK
jgi:hypothetical protein